MSKEVKFTFTDTSKECIDLMKKYAKEGLKASGKVITTILRDDIKSNHFKSGRLYKAINAWAKIDFKTGQPYLEVGYRSRAEMMKRGIKYFANPYWLEFGYKPHTISTKQYVNTGFSSYELMDNRGTKYGVIVRHPGKGSTNLLRNTVYNHINEIVEAQKESLQKINDIQVISGMNIDYERDEEINE